MNTELRGGGIGGGGRPLMPERLLVAGAALLVAASSSIAVAQPSQVTVLAPAQNARMLVLPGGSLLVAEPGPGPNRGTLILLDSNGDRRTFLGGLPSGLSSIRSIDGRTLLLPDGPDGLALSGNTLYVAIGEGDGFRPRGADWPGALVPNPDGVSSPILASVLKIEFTSPDVFDGGVPFFLEPASHESLLDGATVTLLGGEHPPSATVLAAFRPGIPDAATVYRPSHPNGIAVLEPSPESSGERTVVLARRSQSLYVADSGTNRLIRVDPASGRSSTLVRFPDPTEILTGPPTGGTLQSVRAFNFGRLLVAISGASPGGGSVQAVDAATGATQTLIPNLNSAVDAVARDTARGIQLFVLEKSAANGQPGTGRVLVFDVGAPIGREVVTGLNDPVGLAIDETNRRLLISSRGDRLILFAPLP